MDGTRGVDGTGAAPIANGQNACRVGDDLLAVNPTAQVRVMTS